MSSIVKVLTVLSTWLACGACLPAIAAPTPQTTSWKQQQITIAAQKQPLSVIAGEFADKTGKSLLIEGEPARLSLTLEKTDTAESLLNQIAEAFDYAWHVGKSGVILFNKRFRSREEYPQIPAQELAESAADVTAIIRTITGVAAKGSMHEQMVSLVHSLSPEQIEILKHGGKLRIGDLPQAQRTLAEQTIFVHMFQRVGGSWSLLAEQTSHLEDAILKTKTSDYIDYSSHKKETVLNISLWLEDGTRSVNIYNRDITNEKGTPEEGIKEKEDNQGVDGRGVTNKTLPEAGQADALHGVTTLGRVVQALAQQTQSPLLISPSLSPRRLIVQFRKITAEQAREALAELENWRWRKTDEGSFLLCRPHKLASGTLDEARQAILSALPADLGRFLSSTPALKENEMLIPPLSPAHASHENALRLLSKMDGLLHTQEIHFYTNLHGTFSRQNQVSWKQLKKDQRDTIVQILILQACKSCVDHFTVIYDKPTTYESNPSDAYLLFNTSSGSSNLVQLLIAGDMTPSQRGGAFGIPLSLDTLSSPVNIFPRKSAPKK